MANDAIHGIRIIELADWPRRWVKTFAVAVFSDGRYWRTADNKQMTFKILEQSNG